MTGQRSRGRNERVVLPMTRSRLRVRARVRPLLSLFLAKKVAECCSMHLVRPCESDDPRLEYS